MDVETHVPDLSDLQLSLDTLASKLDEVHKGFAESTAAAPMAAMAQGLQAIDTKLTTLDHVVRQVLRQTKQPPPRPVLGVWHMGAVLLLVVTVGVVVGAGVGWRLAPAVDTALIKYTTKTILEELQPPVTKGKR